VAIQRLNIKDFLHASRGKLLLDVRSPSEYQHAHIPTAISFPLFTDEERKVVGTTYKQKSREEAIKIGLNFFAPRMRKMIEEIESILTSRQQQGPPGTKPEIFIYCWRGGMRSAGVAWLMDLYGYRVYTLARGYKSFRNLVLQTFERPFHLRIIGGYTGSGKTDVLKELQRLGETVIDLENIASHKGSAFGSFKMPPQPKQEMFENLLACELLEKATASNLPTAEDSNTRNSDSRSTIHHSPFTTDPLPLTPDHSSLITHRSPVTPPSPIWLEDESQRIGDLNIPAALWKQMRQSPIIFLEIPFEERLDHIVAEYGDCEKEKLIDSTRRISQRLGGLDTKNAIAFLENCEIKEAFRILLAYYDKHYFRGLHNRENISSLLTKIQCDAVTPSNAARLTKAQPV
jgi:tRNA 2-selenouridine synthase